jgi:ribosomal protein S18 acetylase RimI-like enzyme
VLYQYAARRKSVNNPKSYDENLVVNGVKVAWYNAGVRDSYLNTIVFLEPDTVKYEAILYFALDFLPKYCDTPLFSLSFYVKERMTVADQKELWEPENDAIRKAQRELCGNDSHQKIRWKCTRYPVMVRTLQDVEDDPRTQLVPRPELGLVRLDHNSEEDIRAFEEICSTAFDYTFTEDLLNLHSRLMHVDPAHRHDVYEKLLLRHLPSNTYVGVVSYSIDTSSPHRIATLTELAVHSKHKRHGYGAYMVKQVIHRLRKCHYSHLILDASSEGAMLYHQLGFEPLSNFAVYRFFTCEDMDDA